MDNTEKVRLMRGPRENKQFLLDFYMQKIKQGESLSDEDLPIFEFLQKELLSPQPEIVSLSANVAAVGGMVV